MTQDVIRPLGLFRKRAASCVRFSNEYIKKSWTDPVELHQVRRDIPSCDGGRG